VKTYKYTDESNTVVRVIDEDGISRMSMMAYALPEGTIVEPYIAPPPPIPSTVTRFQARVALVQAGHFDTINTYIATLPQTDVKRLAWEDAAEWERASPTLNFLANMLGLTDTDVDDLFILASSISA
jgi:hypothetical protein